MRRCARRVPRVTGCGRFRAATVVEVVSGKNVCIASSLRVCAHARSNRIYVYDAPIRANTERIIWEERDKEVTFG